MQTGTVIIDNPTKQTPTWLLPGNMTYLNPELRESPGSHPLPWLRKMSAMRKRRNAAAADEMGRGRQLAEREDGAKREYV